MLTPSERTDAMGQETPFLSKERINVGILGGMISTSQELLCFPSRACIYRLGIVELSLGFSPLQVVPGAQHLPCMLQLWGIMHCSGPAKQMCARASITLK